MATSKKSEIHALQFAVSVFINKIDIALKDEVLGWLPTYGAIRIVDTYKIADGAIKRLHLHPRGWGRGSYIAVFCLSRGTQGWEIHQGDIHFRMPHGEYFDVGFDVDCLFDAKPMFATDAQDKYAELFKSAVAKAGFYTD